MPTIGRCKKTVVRRDYFSGTLWPRRSASGGGGGGGGGGGDGVGGVVALVVERVPCVGRAGPSRILTPC